MQEAFDTVETARDDFRDTTAGEATGILGGGVSKYLGSTAKLTDANLTTALEGVQAEIDADETLLTADGTVPTGNEALYAVTDLEGETVYATTDDDATNTVITGTQQAVTIGLTDAADAVITLAVDGADASVTMNAAGDAVATDTLPEGFTPTFATGVLTITGPEDTAFTLADVASDTATVGEVAIATYYQAEDAKPAGYAEAGAGITDGFLTEDGELLELVTVADLQDEMLKAQQALDSARNGEADADLLADVSAAINAHIGAGGENVSIDQNHTLLSLRAEINAGLEDADESFTLDSWLTALDADSTTVLGSDDLEAMASGHVADLVRKVLASEGFNSTPGSLYESLTVEDGVVTFEAAEAPTTGDGTWVKGDEVVVDGTANGDFTFTYEPLSLIHI